MPNSDRQAFSLRFGLHFVKMSHLVSKLLIKLFKNGVYVGILFLMLFVASWGYSRSIEPVQIGLHFLPHLLFDLPFGLVVI